MSTPLLTTKLYIPPARPNRVPRPRLTVRLNESRQFTLVAAPAGFGKTTTLSEWIPKSQHCVTWLSLDDGDNAPIRFWMYVIAARDQLTELRADDLRFTPGEARAFPNLRSAGSFREIFGSGTSTRRSPSTSRSVVRKSGTSRIRKWR